MRTILAAFAALGLSAAAAQAGGIIVRGGGETAEILYTCEHNIVGGGVVTQVGAGESAQYLRTPGAPAQAPWGVPVVTRNGEGFSIAYRRG